MKQILLFSTLQPYPFWAGSEIFWSSFVSDERVNSNFRFHLRLADSPMTRKRVKELAFAGTEASFYRHFNVDFLRRNLYRAADKMRGRQGRTLPWYNEINSKNWDLIWFNVDGFDSLIELEYATAICRENKVGYWIVLQGGYEEFFPASERDLEIITKVATGARRFIFIAKRNRDSLERAIGERLTNAFHSVNAIPQKKIDEASKISRDNPVRSSGKARFFNLGRFSPKQKGQHLLLEAFSGGNWIDRDWTLSLIGVDGFEGSYFEKLAGYYGVHLSNLQIVPHTSDVFAEICKCDVLLMPSLVEGTPFAMIESMACGRPAVGTPIGGISELIIDSKTGWLSTTTHIADIADALERMWSDRNRWPEMGSAARIHVESNYNEANTFVPLIEVLKEDTGL